MNDRLIDKSINERNKYISQIQDDYSGISSYYNYNDYKFICSQDTELDEEEEKDGDDNVYDLIMVYSSKLINICYTHMEGLIRSLTLELISIFRTISDKWQTWYKLEIYRKKQLEIKSKMKEIREENYAMRYIISTFQKMYSQDRKFKIKH